MPRLISNSKTAQRRRLESISAYELGRPRSRMGNPNTGIGEVVVQPQYDIFFAAPGNSLTLLNLFTQAQGSTYAFMGVTAFAKGPGHTTLVQPGMLDSSYTFVIRALSIYCAPLQGSGAGLAYLNPEDLTNFLTSYVDLQINHKDYFQGIAGWLPAGGGPLISGGGSATAPLVALTSSNGLQQSKNMYPIPGGIMINPQENFSFIINPTLSAGGAPSMLAATTTAQGIPASGLSAWVRWDGTLIRVA